MINGIKNRIKELLSGAAAPSKRVLAAVLAVVFALIAFPVQAFAASGGVVVVNGDESPVSSGRSVQNTYILEVSTGSNRGIQP